MAQRRSSHALQRREERQNKNKNKNKRGEFARQHLKNLLITRPFISLSSPLK
jgi:hypothetical protein